MNIDPRKVTRFEEIYPKAPYAELIRLAIALAVILRKAISQVLELSWPPFHGRRKDPA